MAVGSPFLKSLDLERHGLEWLWPEVDLAHPLDDGSAGVMVRSIEETAEGLGEDGAAWRRLFGSPSAHFEELLRGHPEAGAARAHGIRCGWCASGCRPPRRRTLLARSWRTPQARALFGGVAAHALQPAEPADELVGGMRADLRLPRLRLAGGQGGSRAITERSPRCCARTADGSRRACRCRTARRAGRGGCGGVRPRPAGGRRDRRRPAAGAGRARLSALPPRAGRVQARPRRRGWGAVDERGVPQGGDGSRHRLVRGDRRARSGRSTAARCRSGPSCWSASSTWPIRSAPRATCIRSGRTRTCRAATTAMRARRDPEPDRAVRAGIPRADRGEPRAQAGRSRGLQRELHRRRHHHRRQHPGSASVQAEGRARSVQRPVPRACTSAPPRLRPALARTGWADTTRPARRFVTSSSSVVLTQPGPVLRHVARQVRCGHPWSWPT